MIKMDKVLLATDFSENSKVAAPYAIDMAKRYGAELHLIYVFDDNAIDPMFYSSNVTVGAFLSKIKEGFDEQVEDFLSDHDTEGIKVVPIIADGTPFVEIIKYAKDNGIDLITMGTHGRTGLSHMLMGSTAEKVIRKAHCPVLTVKHPEFEFVPPA